MTRLSKLIDSTNKDFEDFSFGTMSNNLYDFWKKDLADVYLEAIKPVMRGDDEGKKAAALNTLYITLDAALKLLHPIMPYVTEELFQRLPHIAESTPESICIADFPRELAAYEGSEPQMHTLLETARILRSQLASLGVASNAKPTVATKCSNPQTLGMLRAEKDVLQSLTKAGEFFVLASDEAEPEGCLSGFVSDDISVFVKVIGLIDIKLEL